MISQIKLNDASNPAARTSASTASYSALAIQSNIQPQIASTVEYATSGSNSGASNNLQLRPAAITDDGTQNMTVSNTNNATAMNTSPSSPLQPLRQMSNSLSTVNNQLVPMNVIMNRRPLLAFRRPLLQYQMIRNGLITRRGQIVIRTWWISDLKDDVTQKSIDLCLLASATVKKFDQNSLNRFLRIEVPFFHMINFWE